VKRQVITVGGIDGSGKSSFARRLVAAFRAQGLGALLLHVDDFRRKMDWKGGGRAEHVIYGEDYFDFDAIERCLAAFRAGAPSFLRTVFDTKTEDLAGEFEVPLAGLDVVVVEGVFMMRLPSTSEHFRVWMETSFPTGKQRIIERGDPPWRSREEWHYRIENRYFPAQRDYLAGLDPVGTADVVIDNEDYRAPRLIRADLGRLDPTLRAVFEAELPKQLP
jgi:uridine kinase